MQPNQNAERRTLGLIAVSCYIALVITNFAWMYPILTGIPISQSTWNMEIWLPSWRWSFGKSTFCRPHSLDFKG